MRAHLHFTAFLFFLLGAIFAAAALLAPALFNITATAMAESGDEGAEMVAALIAWTGRTVAIGGAVLSVPSLICAWGLLRHYSWARWVGIFLAALAVVQVPIGTIIGGYILWVLLSERFEAWFEPEPGRAAR